MHHDIQKVFAYHNSYLFFPICKRKEFKLFQLLGSFKKKNVPTHRPPNKKSAYKVRFLNWPIFHCGFKQVTNRVQFIQLVLVTFFLIDATL